MNAILNFLADYYVLFIFISVVLLFAIIGFIAGERKKNKGGVETASATDLPISTKDIPAEPGEAPKLPTQSAQSVAPEVNVAATPAPAPISQPTPAAPTPVVATTAPVEPVTAAPVAPVTPEVAPAPAATNVPSLVIDDPEAPAAIVEAPATPVSAAPVAPVTPEVAPAPAATKIGRAHV